MARNVVLSQYQSQPEHLEGNIIVERFMSVLVKVVHCSIAEGKDPWLEMQRRLLNYRNMPHLSSGQSPASLMLERMIRMKIS